MWSTTVLILLASGLRGGQSQHAASGHCPDVQAQHDFDLDSYMGVWYQWGSYGTEVFQGRGKCVKAEYHKNRETGKVDVINSQVPTNGMSRPSIQGTMVPRDPNNKEAKLLVTLDVPVVGNVTAPLLVLDTDYVSWSVAYSCMDFLVFHATSAWILTRQPTVGNHVEQEVKPILQKIGLDITNFIRTEQNDCNNTRLHNLVMLS